MIVGLALIIILEGCAAFHLTALPSQRVISLRGISMSISSRTTEYSTFLENVAKVNPPKQLGVLLELLELSGDEILTPTQRQGLNPFLIPLSRNPNDNKLTCYIRWPTQKDDMDLQIVKTTDIGIELLSVGTDQYCQRLTVENDFYCKPQAAKALELVNKDKSVYEAGDFFTFLKSGKFPAVTELDMRLILDRYLLTKIGAFPDCFERLATNFLKNGNEVSSLVTCERAVSIFYGWGHPMSFHANVLAELKERDIEAKDVAKAAFGMPSWTICKTFRELDDLARLAGFTGAAILGEMHNYRANDPRTDDIGEGMSPLQVTLDQAAHLMDAVALGTVAGGWDAVRETLAKKYSDGGYPEMAAFILA